MAPVEKRSFMMRQNFTSKNQWHHQWSKLFKIIYDIVRNFFGLGISGHPGDFFSDFSKSGSVLNVLSKQRPPPMRRTSPSQWRHLESKKSNNLASNGKMLRWNFTATVDLNLKYSQVKFIKLVTMWILRFLGISEFRQIFQFPYISKNAQLRVRNATGWLLV